MGFFSRMFSMGQAEAHSVLDKLEDPIKLTAQGIRDLENDLREALQALAEVKGIGIRMGRDADTQRRSAADYEKKAMLLLQRAKDGHMDESEAERIAIEALNKKEDAGKRAVSCEQEKERNNIMVAKLEANVNKLKSQLSMYKNEHTTLKARHKTASATKKLNAQMARIDSHGTIAMLEKMRDKVAETESLAEAYGDVAQIDKSVDDEINSALASSSSGSIAASDSLAALKARLK